MDPISIAPLKANTEGLLHIRFTVFTPLVEGLPQIFEQFFGMTPDTETVSKKDFTSEVFSIREDVKFGVTMKPGRVDFAVHPQPAEASEIPSDILESDFVVLTCSGRTSFVESARKIVGAFEVVQRLACGEHLLTSAGSKQASYKRLAELLQIPLDPVSSSDLFFRINRPRRIKGALINRIGEWCSVAVQTRLPDGDSSSSDAISVRTDVNTSPEEGLASIEPHMFSEIVAELFAQSNTLIRDGDKP